MNPDRWRQIEDLYHAAQERGPAERAALLEGTDPEIRERVERMLALAASGELLDRPAEGLSETATEAIVATGAEFGPYKIEMRIGAGGMGVVYRAVDTRLGRVVAIKVAAARYSERFQKEAQAISKLNHPHVCTLYDVGANYLVMEFIEGCTLAAEIKNGPLPFKLVARYGAQIASALAEAHSQGIVHRDLKPANVMVTRHGIKVLDFGLARMLTEPGETETNTVMGTPLYMAPEQWEGRAADARADLFAFGLTLYEMITGSLPFPGASLGRMLTSVSQVTVPPPSQERSGIPAAMDRLVANLLAKDPARREQSAEHAARELSAIAERLDAPAPRSWKRPIFAVPALVLLGALGAGGTWLYQKTERRRWAREEAIPQINRLIAENKPLAASLVLRKAEEALPGDPQLAQMERNSYSVVTVTSSPTAAKIEIQDYLTPGGAWTLLGTTPLDRVRLPKGYFRWRISKPGAGELVIAPQTRAAMQFALEPPPGTPPGMVPVPAGRFGEFVDFIGPLIYPLPAFDVDRFEVTNLQYQQFIDQGGYQKREYWKEKFVKDGQELTWDQAMGAFRDPTGRPGPSTWEAGHYPPGHDQYPVSGVSWYEAAAYAAFAGKSLPAVAQWYRVAPPDLAPLAIKESNFDRPGTIAVGTLPGVGPYGTYDTAGNVREWCWNATDGGTRLILGGAYGTQTYQAFDPEALPPFDRSPMNGFRTVRNNGPLVEAASAPLRVRARDFSKVKPASDDVFAAYRTMYAYDKRPLNPQSEGVVEKTPDWNKEKITIDAGYDNERLPVFLFLPRNTHPPFETVLFFPSARVDIMPSSQILGDMQFIDYVIKSGRALIYPIYKGTYERTGKRAIVGSVDDLELVIQESKEVRRAVDYLEARPEIDATRLAYLGVSQGSAYGVIFAALEDRFKAVVLLDGGFFLGPVRPGRDQVDFAPRIKKPVLMVNGRYDFTFSPDRAQIPLLRMIGSPEADKRRVVFETPHDISQDKADLSKEVLGWLDKYLGRVN